MLGVTVANFEHFGDLNWSQQFGEPRIKALQSAQQTPALRQLKSTKNLMGKKTSLLGSVEVIVTPTNEYNFA